MLQLRTTRRSKREDIHPGHAKIFNGRDFIACEPVCERRDEIYDRTDLASRADAL